MLWIKLLPCATTLELYARPTSALAVGHVTLGAGATVIEHATELDVPRPASVTDTLNPMLADCVGLPLMNPVTESSDNPLGHPVPGVTLNVYGPPAPGDVT